MSDCQKCSVGKHEACWGFDGDMGHHPDSLPLCSCMCKPGNRSRFGFLESASNNGDFGTAGRNE